MNPELERLFPRLREPDYRVTSPFDPRYNCIAWAAHDTQRKRWPDDMAIGYWPAEAPRETTLDAFIQAYETTGFERCETGSVEEGYEKIAVYADDDGSPTHAARQLTDGRWTSKLGDLEDIEHELEAVAGTDYGRVAVFLKRLIR